MTEQVRLVDNEVVLDFPYHAEQVAQVKAIPGAKWDRLARVWRVPATQLDAARTFAFKHGFTMHTDVEDFDMPANPAGHARIEALTTKSGGYLLLFPYDAVRVKAVKEVAGAIWDAKRHAWRAPSSSLPQVIEFAERFGLTVPTEVQESQASVIARQNHMLALSNAHDADLSVPDLGGSLLPFQRAGVSYAIKARRLLIADQQGLGKTIEALAALEWSASHDLPTFPCLIACPPKLTLNWSYEIAHWLPHRTVLTLKGRPSSEEIDSLKRLFALHDQMREHCFKCEKHVLSTPTVPTIDTSGAISRTGLPVDLTPESFANEVEDFPRNLGDIEPDITRQIADAAFPIKETSNISNIRKTKGNTRALPGNMCSPETPLVDSMLGDRVGRHSCDPSYLSAFESLAKKLDTSTFDFGGHSDALAHVDFLIVGWATLQDWLPALTNLSISSCIYDESHAIKNYQAKRTKAAIKIAKSADPKGMLMLLTGTPITNRPAEYAAQLEALGHLSDFGGRWGLYKRYANAFQDRFGHWHIDGHSNLEELNTRLRSGYYLRRTKAEVMPQLAPIRHVRLMVDPDPKLMIEYRQAEADIASYMAERAAALALELGKSPMSAAVRARLKAESAQFLVRIATLRRLAALAKLDAAKEWVDDMIENGEKVVIAAHHRDVVTALAAHWGGLKIQGGMSTTEVEAAKKLFQEGSLEEAPVIVLSIQAAATGHTLTAAQNILLLELPWTPADVSQVIARLHRIGQEGSVLASYMLAEGTIDLDIADMLDSKERVVNAATEGAEASQDKIGDMIMRLVRKGLE